MFLQFCGSSKKATSTNSEAAKVSYNSSVMPIVQANCTPCHFPPQGRAFALNTYDAVKTNIDKIITAVNKNPGDKGFMPMRHPKLSDSTISVFVKWKESGMMQ